MHPSCISRVCSVESPCSICRHLTQQFTRSIYALFSGFLCLDALIYSSTKLLDALQLVLNFHVCVCACEYTHMFFCTTISIAQCPDYDLSLSCPRTVHSPGHSPVHGPVQGPESRFCTDPKLYAELSVESLPYGGPVVHPDVGSAASLQRVCSIVLPRNSARVM